MNKQIESLLIERQGYVARNLTERIEAVDEALREMGFDHKYMSKQPQIETASVEPVIEKSVLKRGKKKKA